MKTKLAVPAVLFASLLIAMPYAVAQNASAEAALDAAAQAALPTAQLAERYAELVGSTDAAASLVQELRVDAVTGEIRGYGEIDTTLALAEAMVESGAALNVSMALDTLQELRADGLGLGQVAHELGLSLDEVVGAGVSGDAAAGAAGAGISAVGLRAGTAGGPVVAVGAAADAAASGRLQTEAGGGVAADARVNARIDTGAGTSMSGRPAGVKLPAVPQRVPLPIRLDRPLSPLRPGR